LLRAGGRLILASSTQTPQQLLNELTAAGFIHCLVESDDGLTLYRGERPPLGGPVERTEALASAAPSETSLPSLANLRFVFLLVAQTPNKPAWRLTAGETITWQAATVLNAADGQRSTHIISLYLIGPSRQVYAAGRAGPNLQRH
jgi:hypothetical protein